MKWKSQKGYTLIEILVGLTIIGLLFGVGYANFRGFSRRQAVLAAVKIMQGDLRLAQEMALAGQKPADAKCDSPNTLNGYNLNIVSASEYKIEANCTGGIVTVKDVILSSDLSVSTPVPNPITFNVLGNGTNIPSGQNSSIDIAQTGTGNKSTLTLTSGGQIQ